MEKIIKEVKRASRKIITEYNKFQVVEVSNLVFADDIATLAITKKTSKEKYEYVKIK